MESNDPISNQMNKKMQLLVQILWEKRRADVHANIKSQERCYLRAKHLGRGNFVQFHQHGNVQITYPMLKKAEWGKDEKCWSTNETNIHSYFLQQGQHKGHFFWSSMTLWSTFIFTRVHCMGFKSIKKETKVSTREHAYLVFLNIHSTNGIWNKNKQPWQQNFIGTWRTLNKNTTMQNQVRQQYQLILHARTRYNMDNSIKWCIYETISLRIRADRPSFNDS